MICPDCGSNKIEFTYQDYAQCAECDIHLPVEEFDIRFQKQEARRNGYVPDDPEDIEPEEPADNGKDSNHSDADV